MSYQYRIIVNDAATQPTEEYPGAQWSDTIHHCQERGLQARIQRRLITDADILPMLTDATGYLKLGARVVCPWETLASALPEVYE